MWVLSRMSTLRPTRWTRMRRRHGRHGQHSDADATNNTITYSLQDDDAPIHD